MVERAAQSETVAAVPRAALRSLVAEYTGYRVPPMPAGVHRGLPSRHLTLVVTIDGTVDLLEGGGSRRSLSALVGGLHGRPVLMDQAGEQWGVQLALTVAGARALLGMPAGELADSVVDLGTLLGPVAGELVDRLRSATTWADRFAHLDEVLTRVAAPHGEPGPEVTWAWRRLAGTDGMVGVGELAEEVGWSRQHLRERFHREFGLTPKLAARVMRFEAARRLLAAPDRPGLAQIAASCGYYDQAHLNRDWRELAGVPPSTWLAEELPLVQDGSPVAAAS
jgi:AraC-like DNA-binding protein